MNIPLLIITLSRNKVDKPTAASRRLRHVLVRFAFDQFVSEASCHSIMRTFLYLHNNSLCRMLLVLLLLCFAAESTTLGVDVDAWCCPSPESGLHDDISVGGKMDRMYLHHVPVSFHELRRWRWWILVRHTIWGRPHKAHLYRTSTLDGVNIWHGEPPGI